MKKIIDKHGDPDAVVFTNNKNSYYMIWGFEDTFEISSSVINGMDVMNTFQERINLWKKNSDDIAAVGYLSYDAKQMFFPKIKFKPIESPIPLIWFGKPKIIKEIRRDDFHSCYSKSSPIKKNVDLMSFKRYDEKINSIKSYLKAGDVYQINYTQPMKYEFDTLSPLELFSSLSNKVTPNYGSYINIGSHQILSLSPENFFQKTNKSISSCPIKGTRTRSENPIKDKLLKRELMNSKKDRAEHIMIVDLIRNDLGKICKFGTIKTNNLFKVYSFKTIHHMITKIIGELKEEIQEKDIFQALFPGGSVTGAPKQRSLEIIDELENYSRGIYTGTIGFISNAGDMNFNIAIRTLTLEDNMITYPVGGGIVWDSKSRDEQEEAHHKSKILSI